MKGLNEEKEPTKQYRGRRKRGFEKDDNTEIIPTSSYYWYFNT